MRAPVPLSLVFAFLGLNSLGEATRLFRPAVQAINVVLSGLNGGNATFPQLIDHSDPSLGTFPQRYWWNTTYWKGPGSPIVLFTPGEAEASGYTGYLTNLTMIGMYAQDLGAATIMLEHRYWGESTPFMVLDNKALQYLNLNNSVNDLARFARHVELPFDTNNSSNAPQTPWINVGGSYSGALAAWLEKLSPGTFWAYHASSAPVQAIYDYWAYFLPIQKGMPRNCSRDFERIVNYVDGLITAGNVTEISKIKVAFGLQGLPHDDDFMGAVAYPLGEWQSTQLYSNYSTFFRMCDTMEGVRMVSTNGSMSAIFPNVTAPTADGVGLETALPNYAAWFKNEYLPYFCSDMYGYRDWEDRLAVGCFDTYNTTGVMFTDWSPMNTINRQWYWMTCNEPLFYWQTGAPKDRPSIMSRYVTAEYFQRQCDLFFPREDNYTYGSAAGKTAEDVNTWTDGWNLVNTTRLLWANGEFDPWRSASVSSELRPGGPLASTEEAPVFLLSGATHCNDMYYRSGVANAGAAAVQRKQIETMSKWVEDFYSRKAAKGHGMGIEMSAS